MTGWHQRLLAMVLGLAAFSCRAPQSPPPPAVPAGVPKAGSDARQATPPPPRPVKPGVVSMLPLSEYFLLQQAGTAVTYDVRPAIYHSFGHIPGAISWPKGSYEAQLTTREAEIRAAAAAGRPVVLYCTDRACPDSTTIARLLAARGHSVAILEGGYEEWKAADMPTE
jgi:rhodanese-related sulfurtransferase